MLLKRGSSAAWTGVKPRQARRIMRSGKGYRATGNPGWVPYYTEHWTAADNAESIQSQETASTYFPAVIKMTKSSVGKERVCWDYTCRSHHISELSGKGTEAETTKECCLLTQSHTCTLINCRIPSEGIYLIITVGWPVFACSRKSELDWTKHCWTFQSNWHPEI